jgi:epoxyqueuosine reductase
VSGLDTIAGRLAAHRLGVMGGFHPGPEDGAPQGTQTLLMVGPAEPGFWAHLTAQPEWLDGAPDPVDRWSRRVIGQLACDLGAKAVFPFGGPPYAPFQRWAKATGRAWESPVRLLVHDVAGLMVSYRGALALKERLDLPQAGPRPCETCTAPCLTACPAGALTGAGYDVPACHAFLDRPEGQDCLSGGCHVRRACPLSQSYGRVAGQSAYHMRQFHK